MTVPGRGNGLVASSYVALVDLQPQLADSMLDELRDAGVAAYAAPVPGVSGPYLEMRMPDQPMDRLYVDRTAAHDAQEVLQRRLPELRSVHGSAEDEAWAAIVAAWDEPPAEPARQGAGGDADPPPPAESAPRSEPAPRPAPVEDHYEPPTPPPLPKADAVTRMAWIAVVSGPLFFLVTALLRIEVTALAAFLGVAAFVGGFVTLVARMRDRPDAGNDPDDGAVV
jgi:hypothetical protein